MSDPLTRSIKVDSEEKKWLHIFLKYQVFWNKFSLQERLKLKQNIVIKQGV